MQELLFGGAARGGKTAGLLMSALQFVDHPDYAALILRKTYSDLNLPGGIIELAESWLRPTDARWNGNLYQWEFPSGATLTFSYLQSEGDKYRYQGSVFQFIGFDELGHFTETQYKYLFSRLQRNDGCKIPLRMRSTCNPGSQWVKKRFIEKDDSDEAKSRFFIPSRLEDNPHVDQAAYEQSLNQLDPTTRRQLRWGDWDIAAEGVFKKEWFRYYKRDGDFYILNGKRVNADLCTRFSTVDVAGTEKTSEKKSDPDYTVIATWDLTPDSDLVLIDIWRDRKETPDVADALVSNARKFDTSATLIESNGLGLGVVQTARRRGIAIRALRAKGTKLQRSQTAQIRMEAGTIYFPTGAAWLPELEAELTLFPVSGVHDDQVDVLSYAAIYAQRQGGPVMRQEDVPPPEETKEPVPVIETAQINLDSAWLNGEED